MIEDKKLGVKIAESPEEKLWTEEKRRAEDEIVKMIAGLELNRLILKLAEEKLKPYTKK